MFNHARTLLLNLDGASSPGPDFLAEELIPPSYRQLRLPTYLETVRSRLFGTTPDRAMLNYRGKQLLQLLHASPLVEFVTALDSRITYDRPRDQALSFELFQPQVQQISGAAAQLFIVGSPEIPDVTGQVKHSFTVDILGDTVRVTKLSPMLTYVDDLSLSANLSPSYPLQGFGYQFRVDTTNPACAWNIDGYLQPRWDLGQLAANLTSIGETVTVQLFGVTNVEPWATFRNLWFQHKELPYRLGGLLLATIYRIEEVRQQNGQG